MKIIIMLLLIFFVSIFVSAATNPPTQYKGISFGIDISKINKALIFVEDIQKNVKSYKKQDFDKIKYLFYKNKLMMVVITEKTYSWREQFEEKKAQYDSAYGAANVYTGDDAEWTFHNLTIEMTGDAWGNLITKYYYHPVYNKMIDDNRAEAKKQLEE